MLRRWAKNIVPIPWRLRIIRWFNQGNTLSRLIYGKATYNNDGLVTIHNADFMTDAHFAQAYQAGKNTGSWPDGDIQWRAYIICWAAQRALSLEGDLVECGVNRGGYAMTVAHYIGLETVKKRFFLLDTYNGLVDRYITEEERKHGIRVDGWDYKECYDFVVDIFKSYPNAIIVRGAVPDTLPQVTSEKIAFLSLDMNNRDPEIAAAEYFWDKLVSGAIIVLDDYGWRKHLEQKRAFDEFARQRGVAVLSLPTGQGLIVKP